MNSALPGSSAGLVLYQVCSEAELERTQKLVFYHSVCVLIFDFEGIRKKYETAYANHSITADFKAYIIQRVNRGPTKY